MTCLIILTCHSVIGIGLCRENSPHTGMPGWKRGSWAYHGDDGQLFLENGRGREFGDLYRAGDVVGCGANIDTDELFFTRNGTWIGELPQTSLEHRTDKDDSRIRWEIASWKAICSGWYRLRDFSSLSQL